MQTIIENLALILPVIAIGCLFVILLVNIYLRIRRLIPVKVNCWFCNKWIKVHYDVQNCFECPECLQYNGFNSEGDYNKPIPAQHEALLNHDVTYNQNSNNKSLVATNGLCLSCNNNVRLKVFQLANFVPLNENNFDAEIEHFEQQLDKSYRLCFQCETVVKTTLRRQNELLGLKLPNIRKKGIRILDFNNYTKNRRSFLVKIIGFALIAIALCNIGYILSRFDYPNESLRKVVPQNLYPYVLNLKEFCTRIKKSVVNLFDNTFSNYMVQFSLSDSRNNIDFEYNAKLLCCFGALLQLILLLLSESGRIRKLIQAVSWGLLMWCSWNYPVLNLNQNYAQIITNVVIIASICVTWTSKVKPKKLKRKPLHKIKHPKTASKGDDLLYDANNSKKSSSVKTQQEHFTEYTKPHFTSSNMVLKNIFKGSDDNKSSLYNYNTRSVIEKPVNLQDDLVTNLDRLNLGRSNKLQNSSCENPFLKIRSPPHMRNISNHLWNSDTCLNGTSFIMPTTPSSFILKLQFSTRSSKYSSLSYSNKY